MTTPKLRFKEFDGDWDTSKIDKIASVTSGGTPSRANPEYWNGDIPWVTTSLVDFNVIHSAEEFITKEGVNNSSAKLFPKDTILMAMYGQGITRGKVAILGIEATTNQACCAIKLKDGYETQFIFQNLMNRYDEIRDLSNDGGQKNLSAGIIKDIEISIPSKGEQTKIATFLSAVDEKISQLMQKHQLLSQYKQGMMQKLFSQQIRFKADDGSEFEEWEEKQLGDVCHFINGRAYKQTEWEKEGTPVIRLQNLTGSGKEYYYSTLNLPDHQYCYNNDLLYMWSATFGPIFWQGEKAIFHYHIWKVEVEPQQLDKQYMYYLLDEMTEKMKSSLNGSTMLHVTKQGMESTKKNLPSIEEQTKIANFLSAIDQKIDVVSEQLEQAKLWKKGLLQQMFV
ncbi:restriction endonuclease subunit S (plasmid) [Acinetobacter seifertii]|jgi:type I restriction enzyme S subunit|nr:MULTISPECIES: restriction endonuclease subunit S [Acinetobacter calcoaceticus/baumannii complex]MBC6798169.1 hypothetical protein [Acinetobacter baumannii]MBO2812622.1 restriction endonuclease subunit S [Acinetobacter baumannii]MBO2871164.1 restriction endonuclease subunit S [Acinetobacter baumannii]MBO3001592.1 restriction endonuclease subunit S [Acinetobacter baumannii]QNX03657.1 restriction endonuclease subunit S [Acinetobacter seifertii]